MPQSGKRGKMRFYGFTHDTGHYCVCEECSADICRKLPAMPMYPIIGASLIAARCDYCGKSAATVLDFENVPTDDCRIRV